MNRIISLFLCLLACMWAQAQVRDYACAKSVLSQELNGWQIQHEQWSADSLTLWIAAKAPGQKNYDIYSVGRTGQKWESPQPMTIVNSQQDELWPSVSGDGLDLYFVRITPPDPKDKRASERYQLYRAHKQDGHWQRPAALIISDGADISPLMMADNHTLYFARRVLTERKVPYWTIYYTHKIDEHNWYLPVPLSTEEINSIYGPTMVNEHDTALLVTAQTINRKDTSYQTMLLPIPATCRKGAYLSVRGTVRDQKSNRPLAAEVRVYDALTAELLSSHAADATTGRYRVVLEKGRRYRLDFSAPSYSHFYTTYDCTEIEEWPVENLHVQLSNTLTLQLSWYDAEWITPVASPRVTVTDRTSGEKQRTQVRATGTGQAECVLPIGKDYELTFSHPAYQETSLRLNTAKPVRFQETELDVLMPPLTTPYRLAVCDLKTHKPIAAECQLTDIEHHLQQRVQVADSARTLPLRQGLTYQLYCTAGGYFYADTVVTMPRHHQSLGDTIFLQKIEKDMVLRLRNIEFEYNSALLTDSSHIELDRLVRLMVQNPAMRIELSAHTDDQGSDAYNDRLSTLRGEAAATYLIQHGIAADRIESTGYGKRKPLVPNDTEAHRAQNRRVEFRIISL